MENKNQLLDGDVFQIQEKPKFFYIPTSRLVIMSIISFGLFEAYWIYKNWRYLNERDNLNISPFWRGIFGIFFCHGLLNSIKDDREANSLVQADFAAGALATGWVILSILGSILGRLEDPSLDIFGLLIAFSTFIFFIPPQNYINSVNEAMEIRPQYYRWSTGHIVCLVFGIIMWGLIIIGLTAAQ